MPWHKLFDSLQEKQKGKKAIGTTGRGIGPCYTDKVSRAGILVGDLLNPERFAERVRDVLEVKNYSCYALVSSLFFFLFIFFLFFSSIKRFCSQRIGIYTRSFLIDILPLFLPSYLFTVRD